MPTPNIPARNVSTRKSYGGNQALLMGKVGRGGQSGIITERGSSVGDNSVGGGNLMDAMKLLPYMAFI